MRLHAARTPAAAPIAVESVLDEPRVVTESLQGSSLARLAVEGKAPAEWYPPPPRSPNEWRDHARQVQAEAATDWAERLAPAFVHRPASADRLARVVAARGVVVTAGQQPGLFGGPIYTVAKALSALALADAIEAATGVPAAPIFWAATDDADFAEAASTVVVIDGAAQELCLPHDPRTDGAPLFAVPLPPVDALIERLEQASRSSADPTPLGLVRRSYRQGRTIGAAFVDLVADLLGPQGVTVLDAGHAAVRAASHPLLRSALDKAPALEVAAAARELEIRHAGFEPQVESVSGRSLVFDLRSGVKVRVPIDRAARVAADAEPGDLSPNVLLRPVVERALLPSVAYAAGPGELAYFAQTVPVARALGRRPPLAVPRWSVTIVEPHVDRTIADYGLDLRDLAALEQVHARLARARVPESVVEDVRALRAAIDTRLHDVGTHIREHAGLPLSAQAIEGARRSLHFRVDRLERRVLAAAKHTDRERLSRVAAAAASVYPFAQRQERVANLVPFLARYGMGLVDVMRREAAGYAQRLVTGQRVR